MANDYRFAVLFRDLENRSLRQVLEALRQDPDATAFMPGTAVEVEPRWHPQLGSPNVAGLRTTLQAGSRRIGAVFTLRYFQESADEAAETLVADGRLQRGQRFVYEVCAYAATRPESPRSGRGKFRFVAEEVVQPLPIQRSSIKSLLESSTHIGQAHAMDVPVFVPAAILDEFQEQTEEAGPIETGGFLIGEIHRDVEQPLIVFLKINAFIPAAHTQAGSKRLKLTPESFTALDAVVRLRGRGELNLGWAHSHPQRYWCLDCPAEQRAACTLQAPGGWFSRDDRAVHRTVYPRAVTFALLATNSESGVEFAAFGWRQGMIERRGFHVTGARRAIPASVSTPAQEEGAHACSCSH